MLEVKSKLNKEMNPRKMARMRTMEVNIQLGIKDLLKKNHNEQLKKDIQRKVEELTLKQKIQRAEKEGGLVVTADQRQKEYMSNINK